MSDQLFDTAYRPAEELREIQSDLRIGRAVVAVRERIRRLNDWLKGGGEPPKFRYKPYGGRPTTYPVQRVGLGTSERTLYVVVGEARAAVKADIGRIL